MLELVRPARVVEEVRRGQGDVDVARLLDRLAVVQGLQDGELPRALLQDARDTEQVLAALGAGQTAPRPLESGAGCIDSTFDVGLAGLGDLGQDLLRGRVDGLEGSPVNRLDELTADEQPV